MPRKRWNEYVPDLRMHSQWFAEGEEDGSEELVFEDVPQDDDAVEVVVGEQEEEKKPVEEVEPPEGDPEFAGKTKEELIEIVRRSRTQDPIDALAKGFDKLSNTLARPAAPTAPLEPDPVEYVKENIIENPDKALDYYIAKKLGPDVQRLHANNLATSRKFAMLNPESAQIMKEYGDEVEEAIKRFPPNAQLSDTDIYDKACNTVKLAHLDEIIAAQVNARVKELSQGKPKVAPTGTYTEVPSGRPAPVKRTIRLTEEQEAEARKDALGYGLEWNDYIKTDRFNKLYGGRK